jgi:hypothetical protein
VKSLIRRKCATCGSKKYLRDMYVVHYPLIHKIAIHCDKCFNESKITAIVKMSPQGDK